MASKLKAPKGAVIFRRYRTLRNGKVLDARAYGLQAWPIRVSGDRRPMTR
jgi:hypothetical protein